MSQLTYTLIGDGRSDRALMNIIRWLLDDLYPELPIKEQFADFRHLKSPPKKGDVINQIKYANDYFPFDVLIYHRDAEKITSNIIEERKSEVYSAIGKELSNSIVCVVPVVMMESWLLFDETSIKKAAENQNYTGDINLPSMNKVESIRNSKEVLHELLRRVSCKKKRSLKEFNVHRAVHIVAENITDFSPLRELQSFQRFEHDLKNCIEKYLDKWN